jgi:hypothetical protein
VTGVYMDPDAVLAYRDHLAPRHDELTVHASLLATEASAVADPADIESGLMLPLNCLGPDALWSEDAAAAIEMVFFARAGEAATAARLIEDLQETLALFVDRWQETEDAIAADMDALAAELENWRT